MIKTMGITLAILNAIVGCIAGIILVDMTGNYLYFIINFVIGGASGSLFTFALQELDDE